MKHRAILHFSAVTVILLIIWGLSTNSFDTWEKARNVLGNNFIRQIELKFKTALSVTTAPEPKCSLSRVCPPDYFALSIRSGAANVVGPKICFEGKIIMSHVLNNVGPGLNIVLVNGENGVVDNFGCLDMKKGNSGNFLAYLKTIKPGMIVLVASFDDVTKILTNELREVFVGMGSTLVQSVKRRDGWVFAGRVGAQNKSLFEKQAVCNEENNIYEGWPGLVEVGGCFLRTPAGGHNP